MNETPLINKLCFELPQEVAQPLYKEYQYRLSEIERIWASGNKKYIPLQEYSLTIKTLLAMSIYYRRIISGLYGAVDFFNRVSYENHIRHERTVKIGNYVLDREQASRLWRIHDTFSKLLEKYHVPENIFNYEDTLQFLGSCWLLYAIKDGQPEEE